MTCSTARRQTDLRWREEGFTLIEIILAMVLSTALLASLWTALDIYMRSFDKGRTEVEQAQLVRALYRQIEADLRRTIPDPPRERQRNFMNTGPVTTIAGPMNSAPVAGPPPGVGNAAGIPMTMPPAPGQFNAPPPMADPNAMGETATPIAATLAASGEMAGELPSLVGNSTELWLRVVQPQAGDQPFPIDRDQEQATATRVGDLKTIRYYLADAMPATGETSKMTSQVGSALVRAEIPWLRVRAPGMQPGLGPMSSPSGSPNIGASATAAPGLAAPAGNAFASAAVDAGQPNDPLHERGIPDEGKDLTLVVAREIEGLEFRYFDGYSWSTQWNSTRRRELPVAVEIVLAWRDEDSNQTSASDLPRDGDPRIRPGRCRLVIALPVARGPRAMSRDGFGRDQFGPATDPSFSAPPMPEMPR